MRTVSNMRMTETAQRQSLAEAMSLRRNDGRKIKNGQEEAFTSQTVLHIPSFSFALECSSLEACTLSAQNPSSWGGLSQSKSNIEYQLFS